MVWRREIKTKQPKNGSDQPFSLAQRQAENRPQRQRRGDRQRRVARLAAARGAGLGLPRPNRCFREPDGQTSALAQGNVIGRPIRHSVPLLRDVMTAILVRFEWHDECPTSGPGPPSYTVHPSPPNDRSVQQGAEQRQRFTPADPPDTDEAFRVSTIGSLATSDNTNSCGTSNTCGGASVCFTLYHGATHEAPINGIYSFVPCRRADREDFRFARPALSLPVEIVNPRSWRSPKGAGRPLPPRQIRDLWTIVRDQIIAAGCLEGVHFSTPPEDHRASDARSSSGRRVSGRSREGVSDAGRSSTCTAVA